MGVAFCRVRGIGVVFVESERVILSKLVLELWGVLEGMEDDDVFGRERSV